MGLPRPTRERLTGKLPTGRAMLPTSANHAVHLRGTLVIARHSGTGRSTEVRDTARPPLRPVVPAAPTEPLMIMVGEGAACKGERGLLR